MKMSVVDCMQTQSHYKRRRKQTIVIPVVVTVTTRIRVMQSIM